MQQDAFALSSVKSVTVVLLFTMPLKVMAAIATVTEKPQKRRFFMFNVF
jgi:hypothetical protein